jgi:hypothetical protein
MPPEKIIKKPEEFLSNPWNIGDVYAYRFNTEKSKNIGLFDKYIAMQKLSNEEWYNGRILSRIQIYDKVFDEPPALRDLEGVRILPFDMPEFFFAGKRDTRYFPLCLNAVMIRYNLRDYKEKLFTFIGNQPDNAHMPFANINISNYDWKIMETQFLCIYYQAWRDYDYKLKDGNFIVFKK